MARFYFHSTDGRELVWDTKGDEIARPEELLSRAQLVARRMMATRRSQPDWRAWTVVVMDERGSMMLTEPFPSRPLSKQTSVLQRFPGARATKSTSFRSAAPPESDG